MCAIHHVERLYMHILVTGGTGFLGQHVARALLQRGERVSLLGRNFSSVHALLAQDAVQVQADLRDREAVIQACQGVDAVCHAGALSAPWGSRAEFLATNAGGTEAIIEGCRVHGVRRLLYVSSPSVVFDGRDQLNVSENVPYPRRFTSIYSWTKKIGEDRVNAVRDFETVILRPKAIFGPGDQALLPRLIAVARQRRLPQIGDGTNLVDLTYVENVAYAIVLALSAPQAAGKTYTITNDEHIPLWQLVKDVLRQLELSTQLRTLPLSVVLVAASLMELRAMIDGKEPLLTRYSATILARTQTYDISAAKRDLGYTRLIPVREGVERTLASLRGGA